MARKKNIRKKPSGRKKVMEKQIIDVFRKAPARPLNYKQLSSKIGAKDQASRDLVTSILAGLYEQEVVDEVSPGRYRINPEFLTKISPPESNPVK